jgi:uncharacterized protein YndB with AHSA1/START domain
MKLKRSIEIAVSPEKIWPFLVEPEKIMKWFTFLKKFEYTGKQKTGAGTAFYYEEKSGPRLMKLNYEVTEWIVNKKLAFKLNSGPLKKDDQIWSLETIPSGTRFTMTEDVELPWGMIGKILDGPLSGTVEKNIEKILDNLNSLMKTGV